MPAAAAVLVVQQAAQVRELVPRGGQGAGNGRRLDGEVPAPTGVRRQERRQPDLDPGYDATLTQSTRAKLAGSRDQFSPSSALA